MVQIDSFCKTNGTVLASISDTNHFLNSSVFYSTTAKKTTIDVPITEFRTTGLMVGLGSIISLFLFVIIIQLCIRFKSSKRGIVVNGSCAKPDTCTKSETCNQIPGKERKTNKCVFEPRKEKQNHHLSEVEYEEIHENAELHLSNHSEELFDYEPRIFFSYNELDRPEKNVPINNEEIEKDCSDIYLKPISVKATNSSINNYKGN